PYPLLRHTAPCATRTLSLHDALPISAEQAPAELLALQGRVETGLTRHGPSRYIPMTAPSQSFDIRQAIGRGVLGVAAQSGRFSLDRKSTRLNSSHVKSSYAVFCLKKK